MIVLIWGMVCKEGCAYGLLSAACRSS